MNLQDVQFTVCFLTVRKVLQSVAKHAVLYTPSPPSIGESGSMIEQASSSIDGPNMTIVNINQAGRHKKRPVLQDREGLHALEGPRGAAGVF